MIVSSPLNFHLEQYDGPLDLLLDLIRKQQIDIKDIPIATITPQYLEYLEKAREMDIDLGAEFVYMAATLIHIKSRDAAAARSGAGKGRRCRGRSAPGTGGAPARARALQERRRNAAAEAHDRGERLVESADQGVRLGRRRSGPGDHPVRPGQGLRRDAGTRQEPPGLRGGIGRCDGVGHDPLPARPVPGGAARTSRSSSCGCSSSSAPGAP